MILLVFLISFYGVSYSQYQTDMQYGLEDHSNQLRLMLDGDAVLTSPEEGLWSVATDWQNGWPDNWVHASPDTFFQVDDWIIFRGVLSLEDGELHLQDAFRKEGRFTKCIRRFQWYGPDVLKKITLTIRWTVQQTGLKPFLPGILYYGNPSGERSGSEKVPVFNGFPGEVAIFEEHRYPMPFASLECQNDPTSYGVALHTIPSPVPGGQQQDQWWSLGTMVNTQTTELIALSGPIAYNKQKSAAKALQGSSLPYDSAYVTLSPGAVVEKTFFLEAYPVLEKGSGFQNPIYSSISMFKPFYAGDLPSFSDIIKSKYRFALSRWMEGEGYAGFNMYPDHVKPRIVLGWAGQCEAPGYALQVLAEELDTSQRIWEMVQRSLDHIADIPIGKDGFPVRFELDDLKWHSPDPVSEGQAMHSIALAIGAAKKRANLNPEKWEEFLKAASWIHSKRILSEGWSPINTAEAFYIAPLLLAHQLFDVADYKEAAVKAADYYAKRHLDMTEPYWGGTLDATCEDKEGAWGAFQGFLAAYEHTRNRKYLKWAKHAGDVALSYTVVWDMAMPAGRLADHNIKTRGWTSVSPQNQHLDVYGVLLTPSIYKLGVYTGNQDLQRLAEVMFRSCGQMIDPFGAQGEQLQHTNFAQQGDMTDVSTFRGGYSEKWTVFWITAHFLHAAAQFKEMGVVF